MITVDDLRLRLMSAGVRLVDDPAAATCYTKLTKEGYEIHLGKIYDKADEKGKIVLLLHELGHIVHSDCCSNTCVDHIVANATMDARINIGLDQEVVKNLNGVTYDALERQYPGLPPVWGGWRPMYDYIMGSNGGESQDGDGSHGGPCHHGHDHVSGMCSGAHADDGVSPDSALAETRRVIADILTQTGGDEIIKAAAGGKRPQLQAQSRAADGDIPDVIPSPDLANAIACIRRIGTYRGSLQRVRSYARPGRVDGLRGVTRQARLSVLVGVDVSGSTSDIRSACLGVVRWLERSHDVTIVGWDTEVHVGPMHTWAGSAGGTRIQPLFRHAKDISADVLMVVTDGMIDDIDPMPPIPIIWAVYGSQSVKVRDGMDREVRL